MPSADDPRVVVRVSWQDKIALDRFSRVSGVALAALMREVTLAYGPVWVANRAGDEFAGRPVRPLRARNGGSL